MDTTLSDMWDFPRTMLTLSFIMRPTNPSSPRGVSWSSTADIRAGNNELRVTCMEMSKDKLLWAYERMVLIRAFEDKVHQLIQQQRLPGFAHLSAGQEAVAVGVCIHLDDKDFVTSTHRGHGHCIAKGLDVAAMMAELYGKTTGTSKGK